MTRRSRWRSERELPQPDAFHLAVMERVAASDRQFKDDHPDADWLIRPAVPHEMCVPGGPCSTPEWVRVFFVQDGLRARQPWTWGRWHH